jgi:glycosyltransferase involved in cell wall biosynthesis
MSSPKLSILIASTYNRVDMTEELVDYLSSLKRADEVEIAVKYDNKEMSIGAKRQLMIEEAKGEYVVFIDSDDWVPAYYIDEILTAIEQEPDCIGFEIEVRGMKGGTMLASASNSFNKWRTIKRKRNDKRKYDFLRSPYHKTPVKREIALQAGFPDKRYGEDHEYSMRLQEKKLLNSQVYIPKVMYYYQYNEEPFDEKYGFKKK